MSVWPVQQRQLTECRLTQHMSHYLTSLPSTGPNSQNALEESELQFVIAPHTTHDILQWISNRRAHEGRIMLSFCALFGDRRTVELGTACTTSQ